MTGGLSMLRLLMPGAHRCIFSWYVTLSSEATAKAKLIRRFCFDFGFSFWHACYTLPSSSSSIESSNNKPNKPMLLWVVAMARRWYTCLPPAKSIASTCCLAGSKRALFWGGGWMVIICMQPAWLALFWELDCFPYCLACCWIMVSDFRRVLFAMMTNKLLMGAEACTDRFYIKLLNLLWLKI